jgi:WD40 repeat protein
MSQECDSEVTAGVLSGLLLRWQELRAQGRDVPAEELCAAQPELAAQLAEHIRAIKLGEGALGVGSAQLTVAPGEAERAGRPGVPGVPGYEVLDVLGAGGMGVVYRAHHLALGRRVALKMVRPGGDLDRLRGEARAIARLQHPNIVQVFDIGEHEGRPFISMELCLGGSLADQLRDTLPAAGAADIVERLARAVHAAHGSGLIHRDLKPANVLLGADGTPKITDFGLAKQLDEASASLSGAVIGTPQYMAPEQAAGQASAVGPAADVYALGATLYALLTGRPPFLAPTVFDTLMQVIDSEPVRPRQLQRSIPADLETICLKCLHKDPARRYASALELADDLRRFLDGRPILARPVGWWERVRKWCRRRPAVAALLAAVVAVGALGFAGVVWQWRRAEGTARSEAEARREAELAHGLTQRTLYATHMNLAMQAWNEGNLARARELLDRHRPVPGVPDVRGFEWYHLWRLCHADWLTLSQPRRWVRSLAYSPDGKRLVTGSFDHRVRVFDAVSGRETHVFEGHTDAVHRVGFHPNGSTLVSAGDDCTVRLWDLRTGRGRTLFTHGDWVWAAGFSPNGKWLASADKAGEVMLFDAHTLRPLPGYPRGIDAVNCLAFSPGGRRLAFGCDDGVVHLWDLQSGQKARHTILEEGDAVVSLAFAPDGRALACGGRGGLVRLWDAGRRRTIRDFEGHTGSVWGLDFARGGAVLASASWDRTVKLWDVKAGKELSTLRGHVEAVKYAAFCPTDATRLATGSVDGTVRLWSLPVRQGPLSLPCAGAVRSALAAPGGGVLLTAAECWDVSAQKRVDLSAKVKAALARAPAPALSEDGAVLAVGLPDGSVRLLERKTGAEIVRRSGCHAGPVSCLALSPDGKTVLTASEKARSVHLWSVARGGELQPLPAPAEARPAVRAMFAPGGERVALLTRVGGADEVLVWDVKAGRAVSAIKPGGQVQAVAFSPGGQLATAGLAHQGDHEFGVVRLWDGASGAARGGVMSGYLGAVRALAFSADGRTLAAGDAHGVVKLWDPATGEEKLTLRGGSGAVVGLAFHAGRALGMVSAGGAGRPGGVRVWLAATDAEILAYLERAGNADEDNIDIKIDRVRFCWGHAARLGEAAEARPWLERGRDLLRELPEDATPRRADWLGAFEKALR